VICVKGVAKDVSHPVRTVCDMNEGMITMLKDAGSSIRRRDDRTVEAVALLVSRLGGVEVGRCPVPECEVCGDVMPEAA
jgi:hypothetical protein